MRAIFAAVLLLVFCSIPMQQAAACSCAIDSFGPIASKNNIARAKYIVEGRVTFVAPEDQPKDEAYKNLTAFGITVSRTLKGDDLTMLAAYAFTKTTCGLSIENLKRQTFFILYPKGEDLVLAASCESHIEPKDRQSLMYGNYKP